MMPCFLHVAHGSAEVVHHEVGGYGQPDRVGEVVAHPGGVGRRVGVAQGARDFDAALGAVAQGYADPAGARVASVGFASGIPARQRFHGTVDGFFPPIPKVEIAVVEIRDVVYLPLFVDAEADNQTTFFTGRGWGKEPPDMGIEAVLSAGVGGREHVDHHVAGVAEQRVHRERAEEKRRLALVVVLVVVFGLAVRRQRQHGQRCEYQAFRRSIESFRIHHVLCSLSVFAGFCPLPFADAKIHNNSQIRK